MSDFDDFVKNNRPSGKQSKLNGFAQEIFALKNLGYSEKDIVRFLFEKKGISVTQPTLNRFIRNRKQQEIPARSVFKQQFEPYSPAPASSESSNRDKLE